MVRLLAASRAAELESLQLTYAAVGGSLGVAPEGFHFLERTRFVPEVSVGAAGEQLMTWGVHAGAGLKVSASDRRAAVGVNVRLRLGPGVLGLAAPCRVVWALESEDRIGFAYGTLSGHPECGEELFLIEKRGSGVVFTIRAFSRPMGLRARLAGPFGRRLQGVVTDRYLAALMPVAEGLAGG